MLTQQNERQKGETLTNKRIPKLITLAQPTPTETPTSPNLS